MQQHVTQRFSERSIPVCLSFWCSAMEGGFFSHALGVPELHWLHKGQAMFTPSMLGDALVRPDKLVRPD